MILLLLAACGGEPFSAADLDDATHLLTEIGPRLVVTPQEETARATVEVAFRDAGLDDVASEPFTWDAWQPGTATLTVGTDTWTAEALSPSPSGTVTAPLATGEALSGAIAVLSSDDGGRAEHFTTALFGGAEALVRVTDYVDHDGGALVEVGHTLEGSEFPAAAVDHDTGVELFARIGQEATLTLDTASVPAHVSHNVVGWVRGTGSGLVVVTAHYDSWHPSESAYDNALGVAGMLLLAEALADGPPPGPDVVFVATGAEEQGLQGAIAYTAAHPDAVDDAILVLNFDVLWGAEGAFEVTGTQQWLRDLGVEAAAAEGLDAVDSGEPPLSSDHVPFMTRGAPALWTFRWPDRHYHTVADTTDQLDFADAAAALRVNWRVLQRVSGLD